VIDLHSLKLAAKINLTALALAKAVFKQRRQHTDYVKCSSRHKERRGFKGYITLLIFPYLRKNIIPGKSLKPSVLSKAGYSFNTIAYFQFIQNDRYVVTNGSCGYQKLFPYLFRVFSF